MPQMIDFEQKFQSIKTRLLNSIQAIFPVDGKVHELRLKKIWADDKLTFDDYGGQKKARLGGRTWSVPVHGSLELIDKTTGKVINREPNFKLAFLPKMTDRGSFIVRGNEYQVQNVLRLKPGVYTRIQENGELESQVNLARGKNFKIFLDPKTGLFTMRVGTANMKLYPILSGLGVDHSKLTSIWGKELADKNSKGRYDEEIQKAHAAFFKEKAPSTAEAVANLTNYFQNNTEIWPDTTHRTLGQSFKAVSGDLLLATSKKILSVTRGEEKPDERDSLEFKTIHDIEDMLSERIDKQAVRLTNNIKRNLDRRDEIKHIISANTFGSHMDTFFTGSDEYSSITSVTPQTNPVSMIGEVNKLTIMGPGGIGTTQAVTMDARNIHPTSYGFIDPVHTPECGHPMSQVFTKSGWKYWKDIYDDDEFAILIDGELSFSKAERVVRQPYKGSLCGLKTDYLEYLVTPNHRIYSATIWDNKNPKYKFEEAGDIYRKPRRFMCGGHKPYRGTLNPEYFELPKIKHGTEKQDDIPPINIGDWAEFMGWYLSEGCSDYNPQKGYYYVCITQTKIVTKKHLEDFLANLPIEFKYSGTAFRSHHRQLAHYLKQFGYSNEKFIPEEFFEYPPEIRRRLMDALIDGDGKIDRNKCVSYASASKRLADGFQRLAISLGYSTSIHYESDFRKITYFGTWIVTLHKKNTRVSQRNTLRDKDRYRGFYIQQYEGLVYCATVPGGLLYVRHGDGFGHWSGNSDRIGITVHMAAAARKVGNDLEAAVIDAKTNKAKFLKPIEAAEAVIGFRDQYVLKNDKLVPLGKKIRATIRGELKEVDPKDVQYIYPTSKGFFDISTNLIPFLHSDQGNRAMTASKQIEQALPLKFRENPLVQSEANKGITFEQVIGHGFSGHAPADGQVSKITKEFIYIKGTDKKTYPVGMYDQFPLNTLVYLQSYPTVQVGDKVKKGQLLWDSNYTNKGSLALGVNLKAAYLPYKGANYEDGITISEDAAKKLTSLHKHDIALDIDSDTLLDLKKFQAYYPTVLDVNAAAKLDNEGVVKVGQKVKYGDVIIAGLRKELPGPEAEALKKLHRGFVKPYRDTSQTWDDEDEGQVVEVVKSAKKVTVYITTEEPAKIGDKLSARHGNKGTITRIVPMSEMPRDAKNEPLDIILNPIGIPSRINVGQVLETAAAKVAEKEKKPYLVDNFSGKDYLADIKARLKASGLTDKETIKDPGLNKEIPGVMVGKQYFLKLDHPTRKKFSARARGGYTLDQTPSRGGGEGGQSINKMEYAALLAHGANANLREMGTLKSESNDELWRAVYTGQPLPAPQPAFAVKKLEAMIQGSGIDVIKSGNTVQITPMTDKKILEMSNGEIKDAVVVRGKDLKPEKGGIFDPVATGGIGGKHWTHVDRKSVV
jgi:DNA-directed RNA polymerase beta subunit